MLTAGGLGGWEEACGDSLGWKVASLLDELSSWLILVSLSDEGAPDSHLTCKMSRISDLCSSLPESDKGTLSCHMSSTSHPQQLWRRDWNPTPVFEGISCRLQGDMEARCPVFCGPHFTPASLSPGGRKALIPAESEHEAAGPLTEGL